MNCIVVIEDDPAIRLGLTDNLSFAAYDVLSAADGEDGYRLVREHHPDLVILDLTLPRLNGFDVCRKIREDGLYTKVLMLTAQSEENHRIEGFEAGADDYVTKPFSLQELLGRVRAILRRSGVEEREEARQIQEKLLPVTVPQLEGAQVAFAWHPARVVSGDTLDILQFDDGSVGLCIADVCGKGLPAALLMANLQATVRGLASKDMAPRDLCSAINRAMGGNIATGRFITLFYGILSANRRCFQYSNAGHNPPLVATRRGSVARLEAGGPVLGPFGTSRYDQGEVALTLGDNLLLYTDGIVEARSALGEEFGEDRLIEAMRACTGFSAAAFTQYVIEHARHFTDGHFEDDLTVVGVSIDTSQKQEDR
jgi:sigma-B regulation protein RsbU (phosphoserine phosphatase)